MTFSWIGCSSRNCAFPPPDVNLKIGSGPASEQVAKIMLALHPLFVEDRPHLLDRRRRRQLDRRRGADRLLPAHPDRPCRGGPALVRPRDAGGDEPRSSSTSSPTCISSPRRRARPTCSPSAIAAERDQIRRQRDDRHALRRARPRHSRRRDALPTLQRAGRFPRGGGARASASRRCTAPPTSTIPRSWRG